MSGVHAFTAAALLLDALLACVLLRKAPVTVPRLLRAGLWGLAFALFQATLVAQLLGRGFLGARLLHAFCFLAVPLACAAVAVRRRGGASASARATAALLALGTGGLFVWTSLIEPFALRLERVDVPLPAASAPSPPLRIGVLADLQCMSVGEFERQAVSTLMAERPDLILIPGDLEQVFTDADFTALLSPLHELLLQLDAPLGVYFVVGNCDWPDGTERLLAGTRIRPLLDETVRLQHGGRRIAVCGLRLMVEAQASRRALRELEAATDDDVKIVFAHRPDAVLQLPADSRVDLVVAGHTHGGQIVLPGFGPPVTLSSVPREAAAGGLHEVDGTLLYVSRGIGVERGDAPRIRFNCPPEVTVLSLGR